MSLTYAAMQGMRVGARRVPFALQRRNMSDVPAPGPKLESLFFFFVSF